jgi:hypothetical protein
MTQVNINISVNNSSKKFFKKITATSAKLIIAVYASVVYVYISCTRMSSRPEYNSLFVGLGGLGVRGSEQKILL